MSRTLATFKQADYVRAVKAARAVGLAVVRSEIGSDGKIVLVHTDDKVASPDCEFDTWKAKRDARST